MGARPLDLSVIRELGLRFQESQKELRLKVGEARRSRLGDRRREQRQSTRQVLQLERPAESGLVGIKQELLDVRFEDLRNPRDLKELVDSAKESAKERKAEAVRERRGRGD